MTWDAPSIEAMEALERAELERAERESHERAQALARAQAAMIASLELPQRALEVARRPVATDTPALEAIATHRAGILVLAGGVGVGKTVAAVAWLLGRVTDPDAWTRDPWVPRWRGGDPRWISAARLVAWSVTSDLDIDRLARASHLVLDDLGAESLGAGGGALARIDELIDARYASPRLGTVITTNLAPATFRKRYGERVFDRLREAGRWVSCGTRSLRGRAP